MNRLPSVKVLRRRLLRHLTEVEERLYKALSESSGVPDAALAREMRQYAALVLDVINSPDVDDTAPGGITIEQIRQAFRDSIMRESGGAVQAGESLGVRSADVWKTYNAE
ncbi:MAG: hypothetical protein ACP5R4_07300 [Armatimonadota bacterium]